MFFPLEGFLRWVSVLVGYYESKHSFPSQILLEMGLTPFHQCLLVMSSKASIGGDSERGPLTDIPEECYDVLRHPRRIRILATLGARRTRLSLMELTTAIVENEDLDVPTGKARYDVRISLVHNHLPRLAEYGLVEFDTETGVELVNEPPVHPADLMGLLELCEGPEGERTLEAIVHPVRMRVLAMLSGTEHTVSVERLASELAASDVGADDPERAKISLYHAHLPMLADVDALEFDADSKLVTRREQTTSILH